MRGDHSTAKQVALDGLAGARSQRFQELEALFLNALAIIAAAQDDPVANLEANLEQMTIYRQLGDRRGEAVALCNLGAALLDLGDTRAWDQLEEGLKLARAVGYRALQPYALICLSLLALRQGDSASALVHARMALNIAVDVQDPHREAVVLCRLGDAELAFGDHRAAAAAFERAHSLTHAINHAQRYDAAAGLARVALAQGELAAALQSLQELLRHLAEGGSLDGTEIPQLIRLTCYQALHRAEDPRAADMLAAAYGGLQTRAAAITDASLRQSFLHEIPEHREIATAWVRMTSLVGGKT
jgi:tetratricopeptide (TPR) repeat protein